MKESKKELREQLVDQGYIILARDEELEKVEAMVAQRDTEVERLEGDLREWAVKCGVLEAERDKALKERDDLRLQLRNIREACERLREAAFPLTVTQVRRFPKKGA